MLEPIIKELAEKLSRQKGFKHEYDLFIKPELPPDSKGRERIVVIQAGNPPKIILSYIYIAACILSKDSSIASAAKLRDTVERCLEFLPKMQHTLSVVPIADAVALRKDSRRWARANVPGLRTTLPEHYLKVTNIAVSVTDEITGTSITRNGLDYRELVQQCKHDLSKMIIENEDMEDWREIVEEKNRVAKMEVKAAEVSIIVGNGETETRVDY